MIITELVKPAHCDARREPRTSLFVMATLYADSGSSPVKVRDLSAEGALIEGGAIPPVGTSVRLCRASFNIMGQIIWCRDGRGGMRFESSISVAEWLPGGRATVTQQRVDEIVQETKAAGIAPSFSSDHNPTIQPGKLTSLELTRLRREIESLAEDLSADPQIVKQHMSKLQTLDLAVQALWKLAAER